MELNNNMKDITGDPKKLLKTGLSHYNKYASYNEQ